MRCKSGQHRFYVGVDLHARTMYTHILDAGGQSVFEKDLPTDPGVVLAAIGPFRVSTSCGSGPGSSPTPDPVAFDCPQAGDRMNRHLVGTDRFLSRRA